MSPEEAERTRALNLRMFRAHDSTPIGMHQEDFARGDTASTRGALSPRPPVYQRYGGPPALASVAQWSSPATAPLASPVNYGAYGGGTPPAFNATIHIDNAKLQTDPEGAGRDVAAQVNAAFDDFMRLAWLVAPQVSVAR
jgi:hypothetical protein